MTSKLCTFVTGPEGGGFRDGVWVGGGGAEMETTECWKLGSKFSNTKFSKISYYILVTFLFFYFFQSKIIYRVSE